MLANKTAIIKEAEFMETEARTLALSLYNEGRFDKAREEIKKWLTLIPSDDVNERLASLNLLAIIERGDKDFHEALRIHLEASDLARLSTYHILKAKFHNGLGITYRKIAVYEGKRECLDKAFIEYEATRFHLEEAGDFDEAGKIENNLALILCELNRFNQAHEHLRDARRLLAGKPVRMAEADETEARIYLKEKKPLEALALATDAVSTFINSGEKKLLLDAIPTLIKAATDYQSEQAGGAG